MEPTTTIATLPYKDIVQLGGLAVVSLGVLSIFYYFIRTHRKEIADARKERIEQTEWFRGYVAQNNHTMTDLVTEATVAIKESAGVMNEARDAIKTHNEMSQVLLQTLIKK